MATRKKARKARSTKPKDDRVAFLGWILRVRLKAKFDQAGASASEDDLAVVASSELTTKVTERDPSAARRFTRETLSTRWSQFDAAFDVDDSTSPAGRMLRHTDENGQSAIRKLSRAVLRREWENVLRHAEDAGDAKQRIGQRKRRPGRDAIEQREAERQAWILRVLEQHRHRPQTIAQLMRWLADDGASSGCHASRDTVSRSLRRMLEADRELASRLPPTAADEG